MKSGGRNVDSTDVYAQQRCNEEAEHDGHG